jgi:hypothetical protein
MKITSRVLRTAPLDRLIKWRAEERAQPRHNVEAALWLRAIDDELRARGINPETGAPA